MKKILLTLGVLFVTTLSLFSQSITVVQANGGEELYACETYPITWNFSGGVSNYFDIDYSLDGGTIWASVASSYFSNTGVYNWTVPNVQSSTVLFRVKDAQDGSIVDESDNYFTIGVPVNILSPNGGEVFLGNTVETISWDAQGMSNSFNLYYSVNNGVSWSTIVTNHSTVSGTYDWTVPNLSSTTCLIRVADYAQNCKQDQSDAVFTINPATPVLTFPNGGEDLLSSCNETITWDPSTFYSSVRLDYSVDNGATWNVITNSTSNDGSHTWSNKPSGPFSSCLIKASNTADLSVFDVSDAVFSIKAPLEITSNFTDTLYGCTSFPVTFDYAKTCESYTSYFYYSIDNGTNWISFGSFSNNSYSTSGTRSFSVPNGINSANCLFKVCTESNQGGYCDISDNPFTILPAPIDVEVTALNGGESILPDDVVTLSWVNTSGLMGVYDVYYSTNGGSTYTSIANDLNSLNYNWTVPNIPTNNALIKVVFNNQSCNFDVSDATFTIGKRTPVLTYPNGGETLTSGCQINVTWDASTFYSSVRIDYSLDNGVTWIPVVTSTSNDGSHPWSLPNGPESNVQVKVTQTNDLSQFDITDASFSIDPVVELTTQFTDTLYGCSNFTVNFNYSKTCVNYNTYLFYSIDNGANWVSFGSISNNSYSTSGARNFNVPNGITSEDALFKVCTESDGTGYCDVSDNPFTILPAQIDVEVNALNGGETIQPDATTLLTWTNTSGLIGTYDLYYSTNGGSSYTQIANDVNGTAYNWTVPNTPTSNGLFKVVFNNEACNFDVSDAVFTVGKRPALVTFPNGGEVFESGCSNTITWDNTTYYGNVRIDYSTDNGVSWNMVVASTSNDGSHSWSFPSGPENDFLIKVSEVGDLGHNDQSDAVNTIRPPVELTTVFTDTLYGCENFTVQYNYSKTCESYTTYLYYSIDNGATWTNFGSSSNSSYSTSGARNFSVPNGITSDECMFMVCTTNDGTGYCDTTAYTFTILPSPIDVTVSTPNGGETFIIGDVETITWTNTPNSTGVYDLFYSTNGGSTFSSLASNISGNSYDWTVPNIPSTNCIIKVQMDGAPCNFDLSDNVFEISPQPAVLLYPNGGEVLESSCQVNITWDQSTYYSSVRIDYSIDNGATWNNITNSTSNDGSHPWTPPTGPQTQMKVRVSQTNDLTRFDESDAVFSLKPPVELTTVFTDTLYGCENFPVHFNYSKVCESYTSYFYYSVDNGANWISFGSFSNSSYSTSGIRNFNVPNGITSNECKFMVCTTNDGTGYCDTSAYTFTILPAKIDVEVVALNGGETVQPDDVVSLSWSNTSGLVGTYDVYYSTNGGSSYTSIANDLNSTSFNWTVPNSPTSNAKIKVVFNNQSCNFDESDAVFTIGKRTPELTYPNGGEEFPSSCSINITWDNSTFYSSVRLDYSTDNGVTWSPIVTSTSNDGSHTWHSVPSGLIQNTLIKVSQTNDLSHFDISDAPFTIKQPVEITTVFTDTLYGCENFPVEFNYSKVCEGYTTYLYYSIDNGANWVNFANHSNSSSYTNATRNFNVPNGISSNECKFMACTTNDGTGFCDTTAYTFTILPAKVDVEVTTPNGGESFVAASSTLISWTNTANTSGPYDVYSSINGGSSWSLVANNVIGNNYNWTVPNTPSNNAMIEVRVDGQSCNRDASDNVFTISPKNPIVLLPNGGEEFYSGMSTTITWDNSTFYGNVRIEYSIDNGLSWNNIVTSTSNDGSHSWTLPNENSALCLIRVSETSDVSRYDVSDNVFRIKPAVTIITPNGDDGITNWGGCTVTSISFDRSPAWNRYNIYYSIDGGTNWTTIVTNWVSNASTATYNWTMPNIPTSQALVKVEPYYQTAYFDESDATFTITKPVTLTQPNFGGIMQVGSVYNIEWDSDGISNIYDLYYSSDNGVTWNTIIIGHNTSTNTYAWTVPNDLSTQCLIRVQDNIDNCKQDVSNVPFTITNTAPPITITTPNGGDTLIGCATYTIDWSEESTFGMYDLFYSTDGGTSWTTIIEDYPTTSSSYDWVVPNIDENGVLVRVLVSGTIKEDISDALFVIESNSVEISTPNQTVCSGTSVSLSASNGVNYSWTPTVGLDDPNSATPIATPNTTTTYYVNSTNGTCVSTDSVVVTVENNPSLVASVAISADQPSVICAGTTVNFTASPTNGGSTPVYDWMVNSVSTGISTANFSTNSLNHGDEVSVIMTSNLACVTGSPTTSNTMTFTVNPLLTPTVSITASKDTICVGETVNFSASVSNEGGSPNYDWKVNGVSTGFTGSTANFSTLSDGDVVSLELTSSEYCVSTSTVTSNGITIHVFDVPAAPTAIAGNNEVCASTLNNYSVVADPNVTAYSWSIPGSWLGSSTSNQIGITPDVSGMISVQAQNQCGNSVTSDLNITVNATPLVTASATSLAVCKGESVTLSGNGAATYVWNNGVSDGVAFVPTSSDDYTVIGTDANGCQSTDTINIQVTPLPNITIAGNLEICNGETTNLIANGGLSYVWDDLSTNATQTVSPTLTTSYQVTGTDVNGCSSIASATVTVETTPNVFISGATSICQGESVTLTASGALNYNWSNAFSGASQTITPTGDTTLTVIGATANGCSSSSSITITVKPEASVNITGPNTLCNGESIVLTASGSSNYLWSTGETTANIVVSPTSTTVYSVTGSSPGACDVTVDHVVNVHSGPAISATADLTICEGESANLTATGATSYSWDNGAGVGATVNVTPTATTTYTVTGTNANGCTSTDEVQVTVVTSPVLAVSNNATICSGESIDLSVSGASTYTWDNGAGSGMLVTVAPTNSTVYTVTGTNANGCSATAQVAVTVNQAPTLSFTGNTELCQGGSTVLNASGAATYMWDNALGTNSSVAVSPSISTIYTVTGTANNGCSTELPITVNVNALPNVQASADVAVCSGASTSISAVGADSYVWDNGAGAGSSVSVAPMSTTTYTVTGTDLNGCSATDEVIVTANAVPTVTASNDVTICENETTSLSVSGASTYSWSNGAGTGSTVNVSPTSTTEYTVTGTDNNGCTSTDVVSVNVNAEPVVSISGNTSICEGETTSLTASGAATYTWSNGLGTDAMVSVAPTSTITYEVTGTDVNGCSATQTETVTVNSVDLSISVTGTTLTALNTSATSYQWIDCDNNNVFIGGATSSSYTATSNGNYAVIITENGCTDTSACYMISTVGIEDEELVSISVYPNPTQGQITVDGIQQNQTYRILNINGKLLKEGEFVAGQNQVDITTFAKGMYMLKVGEETFRIVKQ
ncbi:T9SS type A sorting domain-containing protein [Brumimicrobium sp.]|uniref:T9SS type A sorting domain-containing protein n=1 Tax=Brumimicrobium sp. TaxID=2029867 RepID=UPI003A8E209F